MTDDELRKRIDRSVAFDDGDMRAYGHPPSFGWPGDYVSDLRACRTRLLDLLPPADDGELVTAVWVRMVFGLLRHDQDNDIIGPFGKLQAGLSYKGDKITVWLNGVPLWTQGVESTATLTRGQFRKLCAALGIPLKEVA